jgi:hypothetical protein
MAKSVSLISLLHFYTNYDKMYFMADINDPLVRLGRRNRHLNQIIANGGYYVTDCRPQAIKAGCQRLDCPMRSLAIPPEAQETDYFLECEPVGDLADLLIRLQRTIAPPG